MTIAPPDTHLPFSESPTSLPITADSPSAAPLQSAPAKLSTAHLNPPSASPLQRRKSLDDGLRPHHEKDSAQKRPMAGLGVPSQPSCADKRRSINPGLTLQFKPTPDSTPPELVRSQTLPVHPDPPSPSKSHFEDPISRRSSNASLLRDNASDTTIYHSPSSSPAILDNGYPTESARTRSASHDPHSTPVSRPATPLRSALRPVISLERPPQRLESLSRINGTNGPNGRVGPTRPTRLEVSRSEGTSILDVNGGVIPPSPSHRADVPRGVESGTDTEAESNGRKSDDDTTPIDSPPLPPPKLRPTPLTLNLDTDVSTVSQQDGSDESSPVERTSIATFIAPALPPIRFSMSGADFSDFLRSVGGIPSLKSLDEIAQQEEVPAKSPTSVITLIPRNDVTKPPTDVPGDSHDNLATSSGSAPPSADHKKAMGTMPNMHPQFPSRDRAASESQAPSTNGTSKRQRFDSSASVDIPPSMTRITVTSPSGTPVQPPMMSETHDLVVRSLQEALSDAIARGSQQLRLEKGFVETILLSLEQRHKEYAELKEKLDRTKVNCYALPLVPSFDAVQ